MKRFVINVLLCGVLCLVGYLVTALAIGFLGIERRVPNVVSVRGGYGYAAVRFDEIRDVQHVDILFAGSSHAYRSFDTAFFHDRGYTCFNIGTSAQTALNTYYLLRDLDLEYDLLVLEVFWGAYQNDGVESTIDLVCNRPPSLTMGRMALATRDLVAVNSWLASLGAARRDPPSGDDQRDFAGDTYIAGGYIATARERSDDEEGPEETDREIDMRARQLRYLSRILDLCREKGVPAVLVRTPVTDDLLATIGNYGETVAPIAGVADTYNVPFLDYNDEARLSQFTDEDFYDLHHLNNRGVAKFSRMLLRDVEEALGRLGEGRGERLD
jgi:hypothetical protein